MLWPTVAQTALAAILCFVPLFDLLGYELSLATGVLAAITALLIGLGCGRRAVPERAIIEMGKAALLAVAHLAIGLGLISANALRIRNCDFGEGLSFFLHLPVCTALWAACLGFAIARLFPRRRLHRVLAAVAVLLAPLAIDLWLVYEHPPIFVYDHLWGYFAGSLYDEAIGITDTLTDFRLVTLARCGALVVMVWAWERRAMLGRSVLGAAFGLVAIVVALDLWIGPVAGYRVTRSDIDRALSVVVRRPGLVIHLPPGTSVKDQEAVADDHAFRLSQLRERLALTGPLDPPIHSYVYKNSRQKARWMGAAATQIARPWRREIHVHDIKPQHPVVPHELVHILAAEFGSPTLGVSVKNGVTINMGIIEGLAEALTLHPGPLDLDSYAKAMRDLGTAPDVRRLMAAGGFWGHSARRAYTVAGSFVAFLLREHGVERFERVYPTGDFEAVYGSPLDNLVTQWEAMIDAKVILPRDRQEAQERFRRTSIFERPCAHVIAKLRAEAKGAQPEVAVELHREICRHLGSPPTERLHLAEALERAGDLAGYIELTDDLLAEPGLTDFQKASLYEERGNLAWDRADLDGAGEMFRKALAIRESLASERLQWVRLWALQQPQDLRELMRRFLRRDLGRLAAAIELEHLAKDRPAEPTLLYLLGRQFHQEKMWPRALLALQAAAGHPFAPLEAERMRLIAELHFEQKQWAQARAAYETYAAMAPVSGERARARDWIERIDWYRARSDL